MTNPPTDSTPTPKQNGRRAFLAVSALAGSGLVLGFALRSTGEAPKRNPAGPQAGSGFQPNAFIRISTEGVVTLVSKQMEVGQGVKTSLPMILAEELEVDWKDVVVEQGDLDAAYGNQFTGASTSTLKNYQPFRVLGATARSMLVAAAAQTWGVPERECHAERSAVHHRDSGRSLAYGALVSKAASLPLPSGRAVQLKNPKDFKLLGTRVGGVDNPKIVRGELLYGIDLQLPGMLYASYEKCPVFGGKVGEVNLADIKALPGVRDAFVIEGRGGLQSLMPGVAIVADSTWAALRARKRLQVRWVEAPGKGTSWAELAAQATAASKQAGAKVLRQDGNATRALASASKLVEATYTYPFICHAALEPLNCTAAFQEGALTLWAGSQAPAWAVDHVHGALGVPKEKIRLHLQRSGGGFGRRLSSDFIVEAAAIALRVSAPVKLMWTREDEIQHDHYRAGGLHALRGGLDANGRVVAWHDHCVTFGHRAQQPAAPLDEAEFPARRVGDFTLEQTVIECGIPTGAWRAPGANVHAWAIQSFIDELAFAAARDPLAFRLELLGDESPFAINKLLSRGKAYQPGRMRRVLQAVADKSDWGKTLPHGHGQGVAFHASYGGYVAQVAEVRVSPEGLLRVERVVCVCDVGEQIVNLSGAEQQVQGAIIDGLSAAWFQAVDFQNGRAVQSNFHDYRLLRLAEAPAHIDVHFLSSDNPPSGLGEPALPPIAPAVCNAIFRATGKRIRELPLMRTNLA